MTSAPLPVAEHPELHWLKNVYQPNARQLTARAVLSGMMLGGVMCLSNLYVFFKTGWSMGVTITACILAYGLFGLLRALRIVRSEFTILENNAMGSVASAAGYMTGGGNMAAAGALLLLTGIRPDAASMTLWFGVIAALGVFAAIPIKRQLINVEQLPFPTGTATAETLRSLHGHGQRDARARALGVASALGAVVAFFRDVKGAFMPFNIPSTMPLPALSIHGEPALKWTVGFESSLILVGAGALMSFRTGWSILVGGLATYLWLAPWMVDAGAITTVSYKGIVAWSVWPGAAILVSSGLLSFAFQWRAVARSFAALFQLLKRKQGGTANDPLADVECPDWWFPTGFLVLSPVMVFLMNALFDIPVWAGVLAMPLAVLMGVVAARVTGETDVTPTKALGPVTQLTYGALLPGNLTANIMSANVTGGVGLHAADLLVDLKSGYLLGAKPRQQFVAQLFGVVAGALVVVPAFNLLFPNANMIGSPEFPAPAVQVWAGVSRVLNEGLDKLHPTARWAALVGLMIGVVLTLAERYAPKRWTPLIPSAAGLGIAMVMPGFNAVSMFVGSLIAAVVRRRLPTQARYVTSVSSGFIAGESLLGIVVAMLVAFGVLSK
jgi:OPT family oligopeptide transporter